MKKRRPEIMTPSLKLLTPHEHKVLKMSQAEIRKMWNNLYSKNKWKQQDDKKIIKK